MKRASGLWEAILDRDNLRLAVHKALRGKRSRDEVRVYLAALDSRIDEMAVQLRDGTFPVGRCHQFIRHDPKERLITAPCFAERVMHHALMNVCEPVFERLLIPDTYACRQGKGRDRALARARHYADRFGWFLKLDIRKYFDSTS